MRQVFEVMNAVCVCVMQDKANAQASDGEHIDEQGLITNEELYYRHNQALLEMSDDNLREHMLDLLPEEFLAHIQSARAHALMDEHRAYVIKEFGKDFDDGGESWDFGSENGEPLEDILLWFAWLSKQRRIPGSASHASSAPSQSAGQAIERAWLAVVMD